MVFEQPHEIIWNNSYEIHMICIWNSYDEKIHIIFIWIFSTTWKPYEKHDVNPWFLATIWISCGVLFVVY